VFSEEKGVFEGSVGVDSMLGRGVLHMVGCVLGMILHEVDGA
jgi:hypothetical protein